MNTEDWFVLHSSEEKTVEIQAWAAGDGLTCSHKNGRARVSCGAPVATMNTSTVEGGWRPSGPTRRIRTMVICEHHVANTLSGAGYRIAGITTEADKEAREAIIAAHWDDYQIELHRRVAENREAQLSKLPESLRSAFSSIDEVGEVAS